MSRNGGGGGRLLVVVLLLQLVIATVFALLVATDALPLPGATAGFGRIAATFVDSSGP